MIFSKNSSSQGGNFPPVEDNVFLVKGLYSDSLPPFLHHQKAYAASARHRGAYHPAPVTYLLIDCGMTSCITADEDLKARLGWKLVACSCNVLRAGP